MSAISKVSTQENFSKNQSKRFLLLNLSNQYPTKIFDSSQKHPESNPNFPKFLLLNNKNNKHTKTKTEFFNKINFESTDSFFSPKQKSKKDINKNRLLSNYMRFKKNNIKTEKFIKKINLINPKYKRTKTKLFCSDTTKNYSLNKLKPEKICSITNITNTQSDSKDDLKNNNEKKYNLIMKHLDLWDKDHTKEKKERNLSSLHNSLLNYYKKNNLTDEIKKLENTEIMLKRKYNYKEYKKIRRKSISSVDSTLFTNSNINKNDKNFSFSYTHCNPNDLINLNKFFPLFFNNNIKSKLEFDEEILKEKIQYENGLHNELMMINDTILTKQTLKKEKVKESEKLYNESNRLQIEHENHRGNYIQSYLFKCDEYDHSVKKILPGILGPEFNYNEFKKIKKQKKIKGKSNSLYALLEEKDKEEKSEKLKEVEFIRKNKIISMGMEMKSKLKKIEDDYKKIIENITQKRKELETEIKIINEELFYYQNINDELIKEYRSYYLEILKNGEDCRKEGIVWVVRNLLELQTSLGYQHFPKFLTHEQIDYLIKLANLFLEENQLIIILKALKKKQFFEIETENLKRLSIVESLIEKDLKFKKQIEKNEWGEVNTLGGYEKKYAERILLVKREIDKKMNKVYKNNEKTMKMYFGKQLEDMKLNNVICQIKKELYNHGNILFDKIKINVLEAFLGTTKNKSVFALFFQITKRLKEINEMKTNMIKQEKENYLESLKLKGSTSSINEDVFNKEIIKNCMFGNKIDF